IRHCVNGIGRIPAVGWTLAIRVHSILGPRRSKELGGTAGARRVDRTLLGARRIGVATMVALHLADTGEDRPVQAIVLGSLLVEAEGERRGFRLSQRGDT